MNKMNILLLSTIGLIFTILTSGCIERELKIDTRTLESVFNELALQAIPAQAEAEGGV